MFVCFFKTTYHDRTRNKYNCDDDTIHRASMINLWTRNDSQKFKNNSIFIYAKNIQRGAFFHAEKNMS